MNKVYEFLVNQDGKILKTDAPFYNAAINEDLEYYFPLFIDFKITIDLDNFVMDIYEAIIDGEKLFLSLKVNSINKISKTEFNFTLVAEDITEEYTEKQKHQTEFNKISIKNEYLRETNVKLDSQIDYLRTFAFVLSHDFREPLAVIKSFHDLVDNALQEKRYDDIIELNHLAKKQIDLLDQMVSSLLKLQQVTSEILTNSDAHLKLSTMLDSIANDIYGSERLKLDNQVPKDLILNIDETHFYVVFQNIISNAIKYRKGDFVDLVISCTQKDHFIEIVCKDNGIGITEEDKLRAFQFGHKGSLHNQDEIASYGIGLFTVKNIIELYKGQISIEGSKEEGTVLTIRLANNLIVDHIIPVVPEIQESFQVQSFQNILFVDDSETTNFINKSIFESLRMQCQYYSVKNGAEAMKYLLGAKPYNDQNLYPIPDLIFLDSSMPVMDGVSFAEAFSKIRDRFNINIKIAMLSSMPIEKLKMDTKDYGIDHYIQKPLSKEKLQQFLKII